MLNMPLSSLYIRLLLLAIFLFSIFSSLGSAEENIADSFKESIDVSDNIKIVENATGADTNTTGTNFTRKNSSIFQPFGSSLHTLDLLANAAAKEEKIYSVLKIRKTNLLKEAEIITRYITGCTKTPMSASVKGKAKFNESLDTNNLIEENSKNLVLKLPSKFFKFVNLLKSERQSNYFKETREESKKPLELLNYSDEAEQPWPNSEDLYVSHHAVIDIQDIYDINSGQIFQGLNYDTNFGAYLKPFQCALLGTLALKMSYYIRSVEWLEFTLAYIWQKYNGTDPMISVDFVRRLLLIVIQQHNYRLFLFVTSDTPLHRAFNLFTDPVHLGQSWSTRWNFRIPILEEHGYIYGNESRGFLNMYTICMGNELQPLSVKSQLFCYLDRDRHPYFLLNPLKTEKLSEYPYIVQLYDVLGNDTLEEMYKKRGELGVSTVFGVHDIEQTLAIRSSAGSIPEEEFMYKIQNKSELLSGLLLSDMFEGIQTVEYTYGRMYKFHNDPRSKPGRLVDIEGHTELKIYGDRVATILYYADVPIDGGDTAFNQVGIAARPVRGSAVFWYIPQNLKTKVPTKKDL